MLWTVIVIFEMKFVEMNRMKKRKKTKTKKKMKRKRKNEMLNFAKKMRHVNVKKIEDIPIHRLRKE